MNRPPSDGYGAAPLSLLFHGLRDRLAGRHARANARWGHLRPPAGRGKVIWLKAGAGYDAVHLAVELAGAIRERRLDVRVVLTFEEDFPELVDRHLAGLPKLGVGYGPCDAPRAVRRTLARLDPFAVILVDGASGRNLLPAAADRHRVAYAASPPAGGRVETAYPATPAQAAAWAAADAADVVAPAADPLTLLAQAQVEPVLRGLMGAGGERDLWWVHGVPAAGLRALAAAWHGSPLGQDGILLVSPANDGEAGAAVAALAAHGGPALSTWDRGTVAAGTIVVVDEARWLPAVAVSARAVHLARADRPVLWQVLAAGAAASVAPELAARLPALMDAPPALPAVAEWGAVLEQWRGLGADAGAARRLGDACRRRFWEERRRAKAQLDAFLQQVFDW